MMKIKNILFSLRAAHLVFVASVLFAGCTGPRRDARVYFTSISLNDHPAHFILDTGSDQTRLFGDAAKRLEVKSIVPSQKSPDRNVESMTALSETTRIKTGAQSFSNQLQIVTPPWFMLWTMPETDGLISWREVRDNILVFDPGRRSITAVEKLPAETAAWVKVKLRRENQLFFEIPAADGKTDVYLVDTGDSGGITLAPAKWLEWRKAHPEAHTVNRRVAVIAGIGTVPEAWADQIQLGSLTLTDLPVREATGPEMELSGNDYAGTLGLYALARMSVVLDGRHDIAYLQPTPPPGPYYEKFKRPGILADTNHPATGQGDWTAADTIQLDTRSLLAEASTGAGIIKFALHDNTGAIADLSRALELDPDNLSYRLGRATARMRTGDFAGAAADCTRMVELGIRNTQVFSLRSGAEYSQANYAGAIADCSRILELEPTNFAARIHRGEARADLGDFDGAMADFDQAVKLAPRNLQAWGLRASVKVGRGDFAGGIADFEQAHKLEPKNAALLSDLGMAKFNQGDLAAGRTALSRAVALDSKNPYVRMQQGTALEIHGDFVEAMAAFDAAIKAQPQMSPRSRMHRQLLRRRLGRPAEDFATVVNGWSQGWNKTLGQFVAGKLSETDLLAAGSASRKQECEARYLAGMLRLLKDDPAGARKSWEQSMAPEFRGYPEYYFARAELARLDAGGRK